MNIKSKARTSLNKLLQPFGLHVVRRKISADRDSYPVSQAMVAEAITRCVPAMKRVAAFFGGNSDATQTQTFVRDFFAIYLNSPLRQEFGSSGINALLTLYTAARACQPDIIIESGVFQGFGSWALHVACPSADVHCYDLTFKHLLYRDAAFHYHEHDWASLPLAFAPSGRSLAFFDDHVNQAQRILEASERGIKWLIFDDNVSWHTLHRDGLPPIPTVDMVCDDSLEDGAQLDWVSAQEAMNYRRDKAFDLAVRKKIARYERLINLHDETGYPSTPMAMVELG
jgi:hypothetical protein